MTTLAEIEAAATALKPEERECLESFLRELRVQQEEDEEAHLQELYRRTGFYPLTKKPGGQQATDELVRQIREEEGI